MPFQKGDPKPPGSGRQPGMQRQAGVQAFAQSIVESLEYQRALRERAITGMLAPGIETMLFHYAYGKPVDAVRDDQAFLADLLTVVMTHATTADARKAIREVIEAHAISAPSLRVVA